MLVVAPDAGSERRRDGCPRRTARTLSPARMPYRSAAASLTHAGIASPRDCDLRGRRSSTACSRSACDSRCARSASRGCELGASCARAKRPVSKCATPGSVTDPLHRARIEMRRLADIAEPHVDIGRQHALRPLIERSAERRHHDRHRHHETEAHEDRRHAERRIARGAGDLRDRDLVRNRRARTARGAARSARSTASRSPRRSSTARWRRSRATAGRRSAAAATRSQRAATAPRRCGRACAARRLVTSPAFNALQSARAQLRSPAATRRRSQPARRARRTQRSPSRALRARPRARESSRRRDRRRSRRARRAPRRCPSITPSTAPHVPMIALPASTSASCWPRVTPSACSTANSRRRRNVASDCVE